MEGPDRFRWPRGARRRDPRPRDLLRRDGGGARHARRATIRANVVASQAELHARFGGVVPEIASRRHLELVAPVMREALERGGRDPRRRRARSPSRSGPGLIGALLVGLSAAKALAWARRPAADPGRPPARPRRLALPRSPTPVEPPFLCLLASGGHTLLLDVRDQRRLRACSARRSTTPPARRSTRARGCSASATRAARRSTGSRSEGDPEAYAFPVARVPGLDFSFSGLKTALLYAVRDLDADELERRRADLAASYQRAIVRALVGADARGRRATGATDRRRRRRRRELRAPARAPGRRVRAARALHRQRGDDRLRRAVRGGRPAPPLPCARCVRIRGLTARAASVALAPASWPSPPTARSLPLIAARPSQQATAAGDGRPACPRRAWYGPRRRRRRPQVAVGQRVIVVLKAPSLAERVARAGGRASEAQERRWTTADLRGAAAAARRPRGAAASGSGPSSSTRGCVNGFSAALDARGGRAARARARRRRRLSRCAPPIRRAARRRADARRPRAALGVAPARRATAAASTIALLDTGVDNAHARSSRGRVRHGLDVVAAATRAPRRSAARRPAASSSGTGPQLAGLLVGSGGPAGAAASRRARRSADPGRRLAARRGGRLGRLRRAPTS